MSKSDKYETIHNVRALDEDGREQQLTAGTEVQVVDFVAGGYIPTNPGKAEGGLEIKVEGQRMYVPASSVDVIE
jgi:hypothetical protein